MFLRFNILLFLGLANAFIFSRFIQPKHTVLNLSKYPKRQNSLYPLSKVYNDQYMRRLHSGNFTSYNNNHITKKIKRDREFKRNYYKEDESDDEDDEYEMDNEEMDMFQKILKQDGENSTLPVGGFRIVIRPGMQPVDEDGVERDIWGRPIRSTSSAQSPFSCSRMLLTVKRCPALDARSASCSVHSRRSCRWEGHTMSAIAAKQ
jgi:hypothetical protein